MLILIMTCNSLIDNRSTADQSYRNNISKSPELDYLLGIINKQILLNLFLLNNNSYYKLVNKELYESALEIYNYYYAKEHSNHITQKYKMYSKIRAILNNSRQDCSSVVYDIQNVPLAESADRIESNLLEQTANIEKEKYDLIKEAILKSVNKSKLSNRAKSSLIKEILRHSNKNIVDIKNRLVSVLEKLDYSNMCLFIEKAKNACFKYQEIKNRLLESINSKACKLSVRAKSELARALLDINNTNIQDIKRNLLSVIKDKLEYSDICVFIKNNI